jgi:RNA polymerase sigma factor (TIGR02999 family)
VAITQLLRASRNGDGEAEARLVERVYPDLRLMAERFMLRERGAHTLQPTALVNEAYLRLVNTAQPDWQNRAHFFAVAARIMRRILVDHARSRLRDKRGGGADVLPIDDVVVFSEERSGQIVQIDEALERLAALDARVGRIVELRFFGGLSIEETAEALGVSDRTVRREWTFGKSWLRAELEQGDGR